MGFYILSTALGFLCLFVIYMLVVTTALGTERLKTAQFLMSSLTYSEEADTKLNLLIDKYEAGMLNVTKTKKELTFTDVSTDGVVGIIWVGNRYYSYGNLFRYGSASSKEWMCNKPKIKTFKRIIKLEQKLDSSDKVETPVQTKSVKNEEVVLD